MTGPNNRLDGEDNDVNGTDNDVLGNINRLNGNTNNIRGNGNKITGNGNLVGNSKLSQPSPFSSAPKGSSLTLSVKSYTDSVPPPAPSFIK